MNLPFRLIVEKRTDDVPKWLPLVTALGSVVLAFIVGGIVLAAIGGDPLKAGKFFFDATFGNWPVFSDTLVKATPLIMVGLACSIAFKMKLWNIGAEGQFYMGAFFASLVILVPLLPEHLVKDNSVIIWDLESGNPAQTLEGHWSDVYSVAWSADGRLASGAGDSTVIIWDLAREVPNQVLSSHTDVVRSVAWFGDEHLVSESEDNTIIIWDLKTGKPTQILEDHKGDIQSPAWSAEGHLAFGSGDNIVIIWDLESGQPTQILEGHKSSVQSVAWSVDGRLASGSEDNTVIIWDLESGQPVQILEGHKGNVQSVAWSVDGRLASGSEDNTVIIWDLESGQPAQILEGQKSDIYSVSWSIDGRLASGARATPRWVVLLPMVIFGMIGGALWGFIPGFLKARYRVNEIIITLMLNYIAVFWNNFWIFDKWSDAGFQMTPQFGKIAWLPRLAEYAGKTEAFSGITLHLGVVFGIVAAVIVWWIMDRSQWGYEIKLIGDNPNAARYAGLNIARNVILVMMFSGALAGLAGMSEVSGVVHRLQERISPGYGFTGIIVAWLAKLNPFAVIVVSILFGALIVAGREIQPSGLSNLLQGIILFFLISSDVLLRYKIRVVRMVREEIV